MIRKCIHHGSTEFRKRTKRDTWDCIRCVSDRTAKWQKDNPEKYKIIRQRSEIANSDTRIAWRLKLRTEVVNHYGTECECCGETKLQFLCLDHKDGGGNEHRKESRCGAGSTLYVWIIKNNFPNIYRVLCHNCNNCIGSYGHCVHKPEIISKWWTDQVRNERYEYMKQRGIDLRMKILCRYSKSEKPFCAYCNTQYYEFLCVDHINGGGKEHRREIGMSGRSTYKWIVDNDYPDIFQILCYNCNFTKGRDGTTPAANYKILPTHPLGLEILH